MLSFVRDIFVYLERSDRRAWLLLLIASLTGGVSRSMFLATVNAAVVALSDRRFTALYVLLPVALMLLTLGADMFGTIRGSMVAERLASRMRSNLARNIGQTNLRFIERENTHALHYHLLTTISTVSDSYFVLLGFAGAAVTLTFNAVYIAWLSPIGLLIAVFVATAAVTTDWFFERVNTPQRQKLDELRRRSHGAHFSLLEGFKELRLSGAKSEDLYRQIGDLDRQVYECSIRVTKITATGAAATGFFEYLAVAIFGIGFSFIASVPPVTILQLITAVLFTTAPLTSIVGAFPSFGRARVALENLKRLTRCIDQMKEPPHRAASPSLPSFESIGLKNVTFRFDDAEKPSSGIEGFVLGPASLTINRGEVVCLVGGNGSGKTVLMRIVAGLYPPTSGELLFNGSPIAREDMKEYRDQFATVFSDFYLFKDLLGRRHTPPAAVTNWLKYFGIGDKTTFADGSFSTIDLSVGQRKRLALIVALLDQRPILVLDEFGAEQDPEHREQFYRVWLPELRKMGMTILIVSHDDAYFECADVLVRMDFGKIVEFRRPSDSKETGAANLAML
jgi:putative pyoverdin transport system ATP-binding/permease protein